MKVSCCHFIGKEKGINKKMSSGSDCSDATQKPLKNQPLSMRSQSFH